MHIFISIFALTWTNGFIFFHKGCYNHGGLLPQLFCMSCSKLVCPTLLIPRLLLRSQHCTFVILTSQLWNKQGRLQVLVVLASWGLIFTCFRHAGTADAARAGLCSMITIRRVSPGRESLKTRWILKKGRWFGGTWMGNLMDLWPCLVLNILASVNIHPMPAERLPLLRHHRRLAFVLLHTGLTLSISLAAVITSVVFSF